MPKVTTNNQWQGINVEEGDYIQNRGNYSALVCGVDVVPSDDDAAMLESATMTPAFRISGTIHVRSNTGFSTDIVLVKGC